MSSTTRGKMGTLRAGITGDIPFETAPVLDSAGEGNEGAPPADSEHHGERWDSPWRKRQPTGRCCLPEPIHARWCYRRSKHAGRQVCAPSPRRCGTPPRDWSAAAQASPKNTSPT